MRLLDIVHPAAKTLVDIARSQDDEIGDGTTTVVLTAGELLKASKQFIEDGVHSQVIIKVSPCVPLCSCRDNKAELLQHACSRVCAVLLAFPVNTHPRPFPTGPAQGRNHGRCPIERACHWC